MAIATMSTQGQNTSVFKKVHESRCLNYRQQQNVMAAGVRISYIQTPPTISIKVHFPILAEIPWHANLH